MINGECPRRSLLDMRVRRGADVGSDHHLVTGILAGSRQESRFPPRSCQPGYFPAGIPSGKKSRHRSRRNSHLEYLSPPGSRQESRLPRDPAGILLTRVFSRRDSVRKKNPAINPAGTPTGNLCLHRDPATNPDYPKIPPGSWQPGYFPAGIPSGKNSCSDSCRESLSSPGSRQGNKIFPARCFVLAGLGKIKAF